MRHVEISQLAKDRELTAGFDDARNCAIIDSDKVISGWKCASTYTIYVCACVYLYDCMRGRTRERASERERERERVCV